MLSLGFLVAGIAATICLTVGAQLNYSNTEQRLTSLETKLTASALLVAPTTLRQELSNVIDATAASPTPTRTFERLVRPLLVPRGTFASSSLAVVMRGKAQVLDHVGVATIGSLRSPATLRLFEQAAKSSTLITSRVVGKGQ
jgi:hypothetical protein